MRKGDWLIHDSAEVYDNPWINVVHYQVSTPNHTPVIYGQVSFKNFAIGIIPIYILKYSDGSVPKIFLGAF